MPVDIAKIKSFWENDAKRKQEIGLYAKRDGLNYFVIKDEGEYEIRVLELGTFYAGAHWGILEGREGRNGGSVKCPRAFDSSDCPVCELVETMFNSDNPKDREQAENWKVKIRYPILVIDLNEKGTEPTPRIYEAPKTVYEGIMKWITNPKYKDVTDLETGRNMTIIRSKRKDGFVQYDVQPDPTPSAIDIDPEKLPKLEEVLRPRSYGDIEYALQNGSYPDKPSEDVEEKEAPRRPAAAAPSLRKPTPYAKGLPATKTADEEPEAPEVEEAPAPKPLARQPLSSLKSRVVAKAPVEPEVEEEAEEEEKPAPRQVTQTGPKLAIGSAISDRLRAMREQKAAK